MPWAPTSTSESLVSVTDYMTWYNIGTASTDDQARIQMALDMASAECRAYTAQFITTVSETITIYPMGAGWQNQLVLPQWPVTAIGYGLSKPLPYWFALNRFCILGKYGNPSG